MGQAEDLGSGGVSLQDGARCGPSTHFPPIFACKTAALPVESGLEDLREKSLIYIRPLCVRVCVSVSVEGGEGSADTPLVHSWAPTEMEKPSFTVGWRVTRQVTPLARGLQ